MSDEEKKIIDNCFEHAQHYRADKNCSECHRESLIIHNNLQRFKPKFLVVKEKEIVVTDPNTDEKDSSLEEDQSVYNDQDRDERAALEESELGKEYDVGPDI